MSKKNQFKELEDKLSSAQEQLKRAVADYRNLEQRISQGRSELTSFVGGELIKRLLPVLDHLEQAIAGVKDNQAIAMSDQSEPNGWVKGVELAVKEFNQVLVSEGLSEIVADGQFDPSLHEAVDTEEPSSAEASVGKGENSILKVVRKGYNLNGKVLRPAQVVVGRQDKSNEDKSDESGVEEGENKNEMSN